MSDEKPCNQLASWDFTLWTESAPCAVAISENLSLIAKKWVFQKEKCPETGREHWQGRVSLFKKKRATELNASLPDLLKKGCWRMTTSSEHKRLSFSYVMKLESRIDGPWSDETPPKLTPTDLIGLTLRPWQRDIANSAEVYENRMVDVVVDTTGNLGKTTLVRHMLFQGTAVKIPATMETADKAMTFACSSATAKLYFVDVPRAQHLPKGYWAAIEEIKSGILYDWRYHAKTKIITPPRVWVFTNVKPDKSYLSADRWRFWEVDRESWTLRALTE